MHNQQITNNDISVIIPAYNMEKYIIGTLDSVKNQNVKPKELIVVNDGATDSTPDLIASWKEKNSQAVNIKVLNKENGGLSSARNFGIKACETKLFALLDADDKYTPDFIEKAIDAFNQERDLALFFANQKLVDPTGKKLTNWLEKKEVTKLESSSIGDDLLLLNEPILPSLVHGNYISCSASVFNKSCLSGNALYDEEFKAAEDTEFLLRNLNGTKIAFTYKELAVVLRHSESITQSKRSLVDLGRILAIDKHREQLVKLGVDIDSVLKEQLDNSYYQMSREGSLELVKFYKYAQKNILTKQPIGIKNIVRALFHDCVRVVRKPE